MIQCLCKVKSMQGSGKGINSSKDDLESMS